MYELNIAIKHAFVNADLIHGYIRSVNADYIHGYIRSVNVDYIHGYIRSLNADYIHGLRLKLNIKGKAFPDAEGTKYH